MSCLSHNRSTLEIFTIEHPLRPETQLRLKMSTLYISLPTHNLSSFRTLSPQTFSLPLRGSFPKLQLLPPIRMGGGPRTFPGGVSKWQWKRMQANKSKQLLKARLARERQVYEMRKRAELKAAVAELERPWEKVVERAPKLFSVSADEQLKVLADRFQRPGGFDMWSERDGPQLFSTVDGLPSARFFPEGAVHSPKPYGRISENSSGAEILSLPGSFSELEDDAETNGIGSLGEFKNDVSRKGQVKGNKWIKNSRDGNEKTGSDNDMARNEYKSLDRFTNNLTDEGQTKANKWTSNRSDRNQKSGNNGKLRNRTSGKFTGSAIGLENLSSPRSSSEFKDHVERNEYKHLDTFRGTSSSRGGHIKTNHKAAQNGARKNGQSYSNYNIRDKGSSRRFRFEKSNTRNESRGLSSEVYDMDLRDDGSYGFESED